MAASGSIFKVMLRHLPPDASEDAVRALLARALAEHPTVRASLVYLEPGKTKCVEWDGGPRS